MELIWSIIKSLIISGMDLFIPSVRLRNKQFPPWYTADLRHRYKCLETLRKRCTRSPTTHILTKKHKLENEFRDHASKLKSSFENGTWKREIVPVFTNI